MLTIRLNTSKKKVPLYRQIYEQIKAEILQHHYLPHQQLPSKRDLAKELSVSVNSVNNAYQQLLEEGYIYSKERSGFYIEHIDSFNQQVISKPLHQDLIEKDENSMKHWISFSHMATDTTQFPFDRWVHCEQRVIKHSREQMNNIKHPQGLYSVRESICRLISLTRGVKCFPEQVVLGAGTHFLMQMFIRLLPENSTFSMEDPGYKRIYTFLKNEQVHVKTFGIDEKGASINDIRRLNPNIVYITPSHQFPTGRLMPIARRVQILNWAMESNHRYILEDDYDSEFKYESDTIPALQSLDTFEKVIYMGCFSKSLMPGLRVSYMILPQHLLYVFRKKYADFFQSCSVLTQLTLQEFIDSGEYQKHIKRMKQLYQERREMLIKTLEIHFGDQMTIEGANAGLHFRITFTTGRTTEHILKRAKEEKIELYSMNPFYLTNTESNQETSFILGFAKLPKEHIHEGVKRLYRAIYG
ncbi:MocR-like transcriptional regulator GabR [Terrilactibacillus laevilacticus]|uniref:PLP-dependent aminotransferase family protein n=1 Tax=Terrilactibacillus laevilacticus TaxID=1380157 RepID=A0ABW5PUF9_9BACI|nr:PLP-dependent aminotransferase family protein [Terrilactibacillus laevilacticus]